MVTVILKRRKVKLIKKLYEKKKKNQPLSNCLRAKITLRAILSARAKMSPRAILSARANLTPTPKKHL